MSDQETMTLGGATQEGAPTPKQEGRRRSFDADQLKSWLKVPEVQAGLGLAVAMLPLFASFFSRLPPLWFDAESYYQHGPLVPLAAAYIVYKRWGWITQTAPKPTWFPLLFLAPVLYVATIAARTNMLMTSALSFLFALAFIFWALFGFRFAIRLAPATSFLAFCLPFWSQLIDRYTLSLQILSTDGSYLMLKLMGMQPYRQGPTVIQLPQFSLNIAAECSGMKMTLAMISCVAFIALVSNIKWWGKLLLAALAIPLSVVMNSLRIALIGLIGNQAGHDAGMWFHDYGSYGVLALSFYILYKVAQKLGWDV